MKKQYGEDEMLALSGIQHFAFCERQWGLIHIEKQWVDNLRTVEGKYLHKRVDDPYFTETRGDVKIVRSVPLVSGVLGLYGVADVLELQKIPGDNARVTYSIVEYKLGKPKPDDRDEVQLCAQALCLEEMLDITIDCGYLYYGRTKHRYGVKFDAVLRNRVKELAKRMHELFTKGETPPPVRDKRCKSCSLVDVCIPGLGNGNKKLKKYLSGIIDEITNEEWENKA